MELDRAKRSFVLTDLDVAGTFLDIAETTCHEDVRKRNIANAWKAHDAVVRFANHDGFDDAEFLVVLGRIQALRERLEKLAG